MLRKRKSAPLKKQSERSKRRVSRPARAGVAAQATTLSASDVAADTASGGSEASIAQPSLAAVAPAAQCRVVGIGASAGGLEALRVLVANLPESSSFAYVVAQHLSPTHESMLVPLLARETRLRVLELKDRTQPQANVIYITPHRHNVLIEDGTLRLKPVEGRLTPHPSVDEFFSSLAHDQQANAIGVVLSGTGSDGARGIRAIHAAGGITFAQDHESARYAGMPRAAIETKCVQYVLPPQQIGLRLGHLRRTAAIGEPPAAPEVGETLERITALVRKTTGVDLQSYKETTVRRRLRRRLVATESRDLEAYERLLIRDAASAGAELQMLTRELLISVTSFFREPKAFAALREVIESLLSAKGADDEFRIWIPGCATGEEAYSIAMIVADVQSSLGSTCRAQIFATDIDEIAMATARRATYAADDAANIPEPYRSRFMTTSRDKCVVSKRIRDMLVFSQQDLIRDPPFQRLDLISCRNVMIYFRPEIQDHVFNAFAFALRPGAYLFVGRSEATQQQLDLFSLANTSARIYQRVQSAPHRLAVRRLTERAPRPPALERTQVRGQATSNLSDRVLRGLQSSILSAAVLVDERLELKHVYGDVSAFVKLPAGNPGLNLYSLVHADLRVEVRSVVLAAQREQGKLIRRDVTARQLDAVVRLQASGLPGDASEQPLVLVTFEKLAQAAPLRSGGTRPNEAARDAHVEALEEQLASNREHLQTVIEELETSNEELQSLNEEMQSANEELQSSNEELETANEELQSTNEELTTVNEELEAKTHELIAINNDLTNVKNSLAFPLIAVDAHLRVTLFNPEATRIFELTPGSIGQLLFSLPCQIEVGDLPSLIQTTIERGTTSSTQIEGKRCYLMTVRPYIDERERQQGAVLTFADNTDIKQAECELADLARRLGESERLTRSTNDSLAIHICVVDESGDIISVNRAWTEFGRSNGATLSRAGPGANYFRVCENAARAGDTYAERALEGIRSVMTNKADRFELEYPCHSDSVERWFRLAVNRFLGEGPGNLVIAHEDISLRRSQEEELRLISRAIDASDNGVIVADARVPDTPLIYANKGFERLTGYSTTETVGQNLRFLAGNDVRQPGLQEIRSAIREFRAGRALIRNYRKNGEMYWNELSIAPIHDDRGLPAYFLGIQRDVTAMVDAENAVKSGMQREKLTLAFAEIDVFDWEIRSGTMTFSDIAPHVFGFAFDQRTQHFSRFRAGIHPEDQPIFDDAVKLCLAGHGSLDIEYRYSSRDGSVRWIHTKGDVQSEQGGLPQRLLCLSQNITQRREADERVRHLANHDGLTGLPNRSLLRDRLRQAVAGARRSKSRVAVLFIDLDRFKSVNDSLGHQAGDLLLQSVADRLRSSVRETDTVSRQSGDEYVIILPGIRDEGEASHVAAKILESLAVPHRIEGQTLFTNASVGISMYPEDGDTPDALLRHADSAMYHAKGNGRNQVQFFAPELTLRMAEKAVVESALRGAIERGELLVYYQPQYDVGSNRIIGAEALVRWRHPERGLMLPGEFISVAEDSKLVIELGDWVLNEACSQLQQWQAHGLFNGPIAVNFSPLQFRHKSLIERVTSALHRAQLAPATLEIELTESAIMGDSDESIQLLRDLRRLGVRVAVDDFGTGYSNLSYLSRLPIDKLKIDRSFVNDLNSDAGAAIVRAVINLGRALRLEVVAEGVERDEQLAFLKAEHCSGFQGYLASKAVPAEAFTELLRNVH